MTEREFPFEVSVDGHLYEDEWGRGEDACKAALTAAGYRYLGDGVWISPAGWRTDRPPTRREALRHWLRLVSWWHLLVGLVWIAALAVFILGAVSTR